MPTELAADEITQLLHRQRVGRVGSAAVGHVHITPIIYGFDGKDVYGHSRFGRKIQYMRANTEVCFEVEEIVAPNSWAVVLAHGHYEELQGLDERDRAMRLILAQAGGGPQSAAAAAETGEELIVYRIRIETYSGHRENGLEEA